MLVLSLFSALNDFLISELIWFAGRSACVGENLMRVQYWGVLSFKLFGL